MPSALTPEAETAVSDVARRHGVSRDTVLHMLSAVQAGGGTMAQFCITELGGSGQWMRGGMTMVGDMFDHGLKARVDALCTELAQLLPLFPADTQLPADTRFPADALFPADTAYTSGNWWPAELGVPSATGGQNDARYAIFPGARRLALQTAGVTRIFDTGDHQIGGVGQQQGGSSATVRFTSQFGTFEVSSLRELSGPQVNTTPAAPTPAADARSPARPASPPAADPGVIIAAIESLAGLHQRGILTDEEFAAKKADLLSRI